jgi:hypothetical protein
MPIISGIIPFLLYIYSIKFEWVGTMITNQQLMAFTPYTAIYDLTVEEENLLRKINDLVDFSFVYKKLKDKY